MFVYTENLVPKKKSAAKSHSGKKTSKRKQKPEPETEADPLPILEQVFEMAVQEDGWARLDVMGSSLYQLDPGFDPRTYGHRQLSRLVGGMKDKFEMRTQEIDGSTLFYVKMKE